MKKKLVLTLLTALLSINILLTGCENDSEADTPEPSSAILQTDSINFSDTSDSIISDLNLLESADSEGWYDQPEDSVICGYNFDTSYRFDYDDHIKYIIYTYVNPSMDGTETLQTQNSLRDFFDERYGEHLTTLSWYIHAKEELDYKVQMEIDDNCIITISVERQY